MELSGHNFRLLTFNNFFQILEQYYLWIALGLVNLTLLHYFVLRLVMQHSELTMFLHIFFISEMYYYKNWPLVVSHEISWTPFYFCLCCDISWKYEYSMFHVWDVSHKISQTLFYFHVCCDISWKYEYSMFHVWDVCIITWSSITYKKIFMKE